MVYEVIMDTGSGPCGRGQSWRQRGCAGNPTASLVSTSPNLRVTTPDPCTLNPTPVVPMMAFPVFPAPRTVAGAHAGACCGPVPAHAHIWVAVGFENGLRVRLEVQG